MWMFLLLVLSLFTESIRNGLQSVFAQLSVLLYDYFGIVALIILTLGIAILLVHVLYPTIVPDVSVPFHQGMYSKSCIIKYVMCYYIAIQAKYEKQSDMRLQVCFECFRYSTKDIEVVYKILG